MASVSRVLYIGVTNNLERRVREHKGGKGSSFTGRYRVKRLVYFEEHSDAKEAIYREKKIKAWRRSKKVKLIESQNPKWCDLSRV